jgi:hypothetical protein
MTNARRDPFLRELREKLGPEGVVIWWDLIEYIAEQMNPTSPRPKVLATPETLARECSCVPKTLEKVIRFAARARPKAKCKFRRRATRWSVEIPKLLYLKDEYTNRRPGGVGSGSGDARDKPHADGEPEPDSDGKGDKEPDQSEKNPDGLARNESKEVKEAKKVADLFTDKTTHGRVLEFIAYLQNENGFPAKRIPGFVRQLWNVKQNLVQDPRLPEEKIMRYAIDQTIKHGGMSIEYVSKAVATAVTRHRDATPF